MSSRHTRRRPGPWRELLIHVHQLVIDRSAPLYVGLALLATSVVAEGVRAPTHPVATPDTLVAASSALAAYPAAVQLFQATFPRGAVRRGEAATHGAWVVVVNVLGSVEFEVGAGASPIGVCRSISAEDVVHHHVDVPRAGRHMVMMEVIVIAHGTASRRRRAIDDGLCCMKTEGLGIPGQERSEIVLCQTMKDRRTLARREQRINE